MYYIIQLDASIGHSWFNQHLLTQINERFITINIIHSRIHFSHLITSIAINCPINAQFHIDWYITYTYISDVLCGITYASLIFHRLFFSLLLSNVRHKIYCKYTVYLNEWVYFLSGFLFIQNVSSVESLRITFGVLISRKFKKTETNMKKKFGHNKNR